MQLVKVGNIISIITVKINHCGIKVHSRTSGLISTALGIPIGYSLSFSTK